MTLASYYLGNFVQFDTYHIYTYVINAVYIQSVFNVIIIQEVRIKKKLIYSILNQYRYAIILKVKNRHTC